MEHTVQIRRVQHSNRREILPNDKGKEENTEGGEEESLGRGEDLSIGMSRVGRGIPKTRSSSMG